MIYDLYQYITNMPSWQLLAGFLIGYLGYYLMQVVKVKLLSMNNLNPSPAIHYSSIH